MNAQVLRCHIDQLYSSIAEIAENINYIRNELPSLSISHTDQLRVDNLCEQFRSALYDVRKEIRNLEDKLGLRRSEDPFDSNINNSDPLVTMGFIERWLWTEIEVMHQSVLHLDKLSKDDHALGGAYLLVAESAANILNAYSTVRKSLGSIKASLEQSDA